MVGKKLVDSIDGKPEKRIFRSIIADYNLQTGLCELIDNALDHWSANGRKKPLKVEIKLDAARQLIVVTDNAGGVKESELRLLISPGASRGEMGLDLIGIFGVGGKRAGVALGELVEIRTRYGKSSTYQIDINSEWLGSDDWDIDYFQVSSISEGSTTVEISKLRQVFNENEVEKIKSHLGEIYSWFIKKGCEISVNDQAIKPVDFNSWAYPPSYLPRHATFEVWPTSDQFLKVDIVAGLILDRDPVSENYGVYIYCNNRLIVKEMRTREVGYFVSTEAGVPHPDASLCRVVVKIDGAPELMPWNSSKSDVNISHPAFMQLGSTIISLVGFYSKLSRRWKNDWKSNVFRHNKGKFEDVDIQDIKTGKKMVMPKLPRGQKLVYIQKLLEANKSNMKKAPYTTGLIEAMGLVEVVRKQKILTKNRAALILLDSNFEIALKEYIVSETTLFPPFEYTDKKITSLFKQRTSVINEVKRHVPQLTTELLKKVNHYYGLRNKLIHERTTIPISDQQIDDYEETIQKVLRLLFKIKFPKK